MNNQSWPTIDPAQLRVGIFVFLDLGWTEHPFPLNRFKIKDEEQLAQIRALGLRRVKYVPEKSDVDPLPLSSNTSDNDGPQNERKETPLSEDPSIAAKRMRAEILHAQQASLTVCEAHFSRASHSLKKIYLNVRRDPKTCCNEANSLMDGVMKELSGSGDVAIRLLSEKAGEEVAAHPLNVTILSVLLGNAIGMNPEQLRQLGLGALLHDIGKSELPLRVRNKEDLRLQQDIAHYFTHVDQGVELAIRMDLPPPAISVIREHHAYKDGSGYGTARSTPEVERLVQIVSIANQYDNLCNSANPLKALTPHEAVSMMFSRQRGLFDQEMLTLFIRMMGVYPPGSVVQLNDQRFALVTTVNMTRPLKPQVLIYDEGVPAEDAIIVNLEDVVELSVTRSLKPSQLPRAVFDYLSPRTRLCYYFERARVPKGSTE